MGARPSSTSLVSFGRGAALGFPRCGFLCGLDGRFGLGFFDDMFSADWLFDGVAALGFGGVAAFDFGRDFGLGGDVRSTLGTSEPGLIFERLTRLRSVSIESTQTVTTSPTDSTS